MGFNNGYESGYEDAKAELMPRIKALEAQLASGASSSTNYASGPGGGTAPGVEPARPPVPIGVFSMDENGNLTLDLTTSRSSWLVGSFLEGFSGANGDKVTMSSAADDSDAVDLLAEGIAWMITPDTSEMDMSPNAARVLAGKSYALELGCNSATWFDYGLSQLNDSSKAKLNITINGTTVSYKLVHHS